MLKHVLHTGVAVADLEKAVQLYESLGFAVHKRFEKPEPKAQVATVKKGGTAFELWQFVDAGHPLAAFIRNHVAIYSDNLEADLDALIAQGCKLVIPVTEGVVMRYGFVQDAAGCCYEIATEKQA
ncbi:MAG TPA: VOC family protein [Candidatus Saccharimonadales bacterium]|nr:VOC family protein [Candidatus Saccharimonadales bacterium]